MTTVSSSSGPHVDSAAKASRIRSRVAFSSTKSVVAPPSVSANSASSATASRRASAAGRYPASSVPFDCDSSTLLRAEEKSARARTRKLMESTLSALEPTGAVPYGVRLSTCHGIALSMQALVHDRAAGRAHRVPRRCAARGSAQIVTWRKHCEARKPAQRLHSGCRAALKRETADSMSSSASFCS